MLESENILSFKRCRCGALIEPGETKCEDCEMEDRDDS